MVVGISAMTVFFLLFLIILYLLFAQKIQSGIMRIVLRRIYKKYNTQLWPIMSRIDMTPPVLNVAFPDKSIVYYANSFQSTDNPTLRGQMPPMIFFWSLTIYDESGKPVNWISDAMFPTSSFNVSISRNNKNELRDGVYNMKSPSKGVYCVIQRVYVSEETPDPVNYLPEITGLSRKLKTTNNAQRIKNSTDIQKLLYKEFEKKTKGKTPSQIFTNVNVNQFFLPSKNQVSLAFPNPYALYLMVFPCPDKKVIRVDGTLPNMKNNKYGVRFVSFMASNMLNTATDNSISVENLKTDDQTNYVLFVATSETDAENRGYDNTKHNLILWNKENPYPVLIYRLVSTEEEPTGVFAINNPTYSVSSTLLQPIMKDQYPLATCF